MRVEAVMDAEQTGMPETIPPERLRLAHVRKSFGGLAVAADVSLAVRAGEIHALIGPNGAGKTSLIAQIAGELKPDGGQILLDGRDITRLSVHARARAGLARSFQITALMEELTVMENMLLAIGGQRRLRRVLALPAAGAADMRARARAGLDEAGLGGRADVAAGALSHGERRQLELAMALAGRPKVLLLDEPMAGLSAAESRAMTARIARLKGGAAAILLVEHDMDAVFALADTVSVLVRGEIIGSGPPEEISTNAAVREAYLG